MVTVERPKKKIIVTGSTGYIGKSIYTFLKKKNIETIGLSRKKSDLKVNLLNKKATVKKLNKYKDYELIHCAGFVPKNEKQYEDKILNKKNLDIANNLLSTKIKKIYFISTFSVYQNNKNAFEKKLKPKKSTNEYANNKIKIENLFLSSERIVKILRIPGIFGGYRKSGLIFNCMKTLKRSEDFMIKKSYPKWVGMHIDDLIEIIYEIIENDINKKILNICYNKNYTLSETIKLIYSLYGKKINLKKGQYFKIHNHFKYKTDVSFLKSLRKEYEKI